MSFRVSILLPVIRYGNDVQNRNSFETLALCREMQGKLPTVGSGSMENSIYIGHQAKEMAFVGDAKFGIFVFQRRGVFNLAVCLNDVSEIVCCIWREVVNGQRLCREQPCMSCHNISSDDAAL